MGNYVVCCAPHTIAAVKDCQDKFWFNRGRAIKIVSHTHFPVGRSLGLHWIEVKLTNIQQYLLPLIVTLYIHSLRHIFQFYSIFLFTHKLLLKKKSTHETTFSVVPWRKIPYGYACFRSHKHSATPNSATKNILFVIKFFFIAAFSSTSFFHTD